MLRGIIDFDHFVPFSIILTLAGRHKVSVKQDLLASFFHKPLFSEDAVQVQRPDATAFKTLLLLSSSVNGSANKIKLK